MLPLAHNNLRFTSRMLLAAFMLSVAPCVLYAQDLPPVEEAIKPPATQPAKEADSFVVAPDPVISVEATSAPSIDGLGLKDAAQGSAASLATGLWKASSPEALIDQIKHVPTYIPSETLRRLVIRVLSIGSDSTPSPKNSGKLLSSRLEKLLELGAWDAVRSITALIPQTLATPDIFAVSNTLMWLDGRDKDACKDIEAHIVKLDDPYWKQARVVCQLREGKVDEAALAQEVLREQNRLPSAFVLDVYKRLSDAKSKINWPSTYTLFDAAMLTQVGVPDSAFKSVLQSLPIGVSYRLADAGRFVVSPAYRIPLLEVATEGGLATLDALMIAYRSVTVDPKKSALNQKNNPLALFTARAGFFQAMEQATSVDEKAKQLSALVNSLHTAGLHRVSSALIRRVLETTSAESISDDTFAVIARPSVSAFIGDTAKAKTWQQRLAESKDAAKVESAAQLMQVIQFASGQDVTAKASASGRCNARIKGLSAVFTKQADAGSALYDRTVISGESPSPVLMNALREASSAGKKGEVVLLSAIALGNTPLEKLNDLVLTDVVQALKQAGFESQARGLALEAMLACVVAP